MKYSKEQIAHELMRAQTEIRTVLYDDKIGESERGLGRDVRVPLSLRSIFIFHHLLRLSTEGHTNF